MSLYRIDTNSLKRIDILDQKFGKFKRDINI